MGLTGRLLWASSCSKKQWRKMFWKVRAAVKKAGDGRRWAKHHLKYQYDPSSYALNFDDGPNSKPISEEPLTDQGNLTLQQHFKFHLLHFNPITIVTTTTASGTPIQSSSTWIYVFWLKI